MASPAESLNNLRFMKREQAEGEGAKGLKVSKQGALYIHRTGTKYLCKDCIMFIPSMERCLIHSDVTVVKPNMTCGYFVKGKPYPGLKPMGGVSPRESGLVTPIDGASCAKCEYFSAKKQDCQVVDKDSLGDDPGLIHAQACCANFEEPD